MKEHRGQNIMNSSRHHESSLSPTAAPMAVSNKAVVETSCNLLQTCASRSKVQNNGP